MKECKDTKQKLTELKKRVEKRKMNGFVSSEKKNVSVENAMYRDLKFEVYKTL